MTYCFTIYTITYGYAYVHVLIYFCNFVLFTSQNKNLVMVGHYLILLIIYIRM